MHGGAEAAGVNVVLMDARENQLVPAGAYQVEAHSAFARRHEPTVDQVAGVSCGGEGIDELRADFIAARTDRWADRHDKVRGLTAELTLHFLDCRHRDACGGSAPARMYRCDGPHPRVGDEQRDTIGGAHDERNIRRRRNDRVGHGALVVHCLERVERDICVDADDVSTVDLVEGDDATGLNVDRGGERALGVRGR